MVILSFQHNTWSAPSKSPWMAVCDESARWERQVKNCIASIGSKRTRYDLSHSNEKREVVVTSIFGAGFQHYNELPESNNLSK